MSYCLSSHEARWSPCAHRMVVIHAPVFSQTHNRSWSICFDCWKGTRGSRHVFYAVRTSLNGFFAIRRQPNRAGNELPTSQHRISLRIVCCCYFTFVCLHTKQAIEPWIHRTKTLTAGECDKADCLKRSMDACANKSLCWLDMTGSSTLNTLATILWDCTNP